MKPQFIFVYHAIPGTILQIVTSIYLKFWAWPVCGWTGLGEWFNPSEHMRSAKAAPRNDRASLAKAERLPCAYRVARPDQHSCPLQAPCRLPTGADPGNPGSSPQSHQSRHGGEEQGAWKGHQEFLLENLSLCKRKRQETNVSPSPSIPTTTPFQSSELHRVHVTLPR